MTPALRKLITYGTSKPASPLDWQVESMDLLSLVIKKALYHRHDGKASQMIWYYIFFSPSLFILLVHADE